MATKKKYEIVLRHNPSGKATSAGKGKKIRAMGPYNSRAAAVADAKALKTKKGVAVLVEPVKAARKARKPKGAQRVSPAADPTPSSTVRRMIRRSWARQARSRTGPTRGSRGGIVSNPSTRRAYHRHAGPSTHVSSSRRHHGPAGVISNPRKKPKKPKARRSRGRGGPTSPMRAGFALSNPSKHKLRTGHTVTWEDDGTLTLKKGRKIIAKGLRSVSEALHLAYLDAGWVFRSSSKGRGRWVAPPKKK
jgi:hypothetical protein